jgi:hypothetical protein
MQTYRDQLARDAWSGWQPRFLELLEFLDGQTQGGQWCPAKGMSKTRCVERVNRLSDQELEALIWRGIIPPPEDMWEQPAPFPRSATATVWWTPRGGRVIEDPALDHCLYGVLSGDGVELRLRPGELDLLRAAGFPRCWPDVLAVLWRQLTQPTDAPALLAA